MRYERPSGQRDCFVADPIADEPGVLLIHLHLRGIGRTSGVGVEMDIFELVRMRDGLVWCNTFFRDRAEAIEAARAPEKAAASA